MDYVQEHNNSEDPYVSRFVRPVTREHISINFNRQPRVRCIARMHRRHNGLRIYLGSAKPALRQAVPNETGLQVPKTWPHRNPVHGNNCLWLLLSVSRLAGMSVKERQRCRPQMRQLPETTKPEAWSQRCLTERRNWPEPKRRRWYECSTIRSRQGQRIIRTISPQEEKCTGSSSTNQDNNGESHVSGQQDEVQQHGRNVQTSSRGARQRQCTSEQQTSGN